MIKDNAKSHLGIDLDKINQGINKVQDTHESLEKFVKSDFELGKLADTVQHVKGFIDIWNTDDDPNDDYGIPTFEL